MMPVPSGGTRGIDSAYCGKQRDESGENETSRWW
jgi:hypothetical protein